MITKETMNIKRYLYLALGFVCVGLAYIGFVTPGIPFSIFLVIAAWAFAKSSKKFHTWLLSHKRFGPILQNWEKHKVGKVKAVNAVRALNSDLDSSLYLFK